MQRIQAAQGVLRLAVALEFAGHGIAAIFVHAPWIPFFSVVGIDADDARMLLPFIGLLDLACAIWVLVRPNRWVFAWMTLWGFWTALLRPLSGLSVIDFLERGANWGAPLAAFLLHGRAKVPKAPTMK